LNAAGSTPKAAANAGAKPPLRKCARGCTQEQNNESQTMQASVRLMHDVTSQSILLRSFDDEEFHFNMAA
jgi:hypothetical protein